MRVLSLWRPLARGLRALVRGAEADRDAADEVQHYLEQAAAEHAARGLPPEEALRAARVELGSPTSVRQEVRGSGWERGVETLAADLRYGARRLRAEPGFTAVGVLTVALGVGTTTAIWSAVKPVLFEPLPYRDPARIVAVVEVNRDGSRNDGTFGVYRGLRDRLRSFEELAVLKPWRPALAGAEPPERLEGQRVSFGYFRVLGEAPALGRDFDPGDDRLGAPDVVVLSDALWRRRFGADPSIVGRSLRLDDAPVLVVGVMPRGFEDALSPASELWAPLKYEMSLDQAWGHHLRTLGRLRAGVTVEQASRDVDRAGHGVIDEQRPQSYGSDVRFVVRPLQDDLTRAVRPLLVAVLGAVALVLVIACVNVSSLLLARGVRRRGEMALRAALGASRGRLVRQLLTESLLLAAAGSAVGLAVAMLGLRSVEALRPPGLARASALDVDGAALGFGLVVTTLAGVASGLVPALRASRPDPRAGPRLGSTRVVGGSLRARSALVVAEVALALVLLAGAGLLLRSLEKLLAVDAGFDASGLLTLQVQVSGRRFDRERTLRFFEQALDAVRGVPGVAAAALTSQLPLSGDRDEYGVHFEAGASGGAASYSAFRYAVSPAYLETMRIPLRRGRAIDESDRGSAPKVALVSESLARRRFAGLDPLGQPLRVGPRSGAPYAIVGVVADVKQVSLALSQPEAVYLPAGQWPYGDGTMTIVVRARSDAARLAPAIRRAVWSVDKDQPIVRVATMPDLLAASAAERRFALRLFAAFALVALVLAAAGVYGVLAGIVAERTREIGVRAALGASRADVVALVVRHGLRLTAIGTAMGLAGAAVGSRAVAALLFGVSRHDPATYAAVIALLGAVSLAASAAPAWRAARVDPASTLRAE